LFSRGSRFSPAEFLEICELQVVCARTKQAP
jgi:hypothetical protein